jgi:hypothetical protein
MCDFLRGMQTSTPRIEDYSTLIIQKRWSTYSTDTTDKNNLNAQYFGPYYTLYIRARIFDYKKNVLGARTLPRNVNPAQALRGMPGKEVQSPRLRAHIWGFGSAVATKCVTPED